MNELEALTPSVALVGNAERKTQGGKEYIVVEAVILREGILNGSHGPLFYSGEEITANLGMWNGIPVTASHPVRTLPDGKRVSVSAREPDISASYQIGATYNDRIENGERKVDVWLDVLSCNAKDGRIVPTVLRRDPVNVSTGIFSERRPATVNNRWNGQTYTHSVHSIRADHLAVLMDEDGACSVRDGCGININAERASSLSETEKSALFLYNRDWPKSKRDKTPKEDFAGPHESFPIQTQTDVAAAAKLIGHADDPESVKSRIRAVAKRKGLKVPDSWTINSDTPDPKELLAVSSYLAKHGAMPGYGQVYVKGKDVWYVGGDGDEWPEKGNFPEKKFKEVSGVVSVRYEAEAFPKEDGWELVKNSYHTLTGETMDKAQTIDWLVTNCECWKGEGSRITLNSLDESILGKLKTNAEKASRLDLTVNALKEIGATVKAPANVTLADLPGLVKNAMSTEKGGTGKPMPGKSSGDPSVDMKKKKLPKDGNEGKYDEDSDEEEEESEGKKPKMTKNQFAGILSGNPGLTAYLVANGMPEAATKGTDREGKDPLSDSDDGHQRGTETDADQPMGGEEDRTGKMGGKKKMSAMTKNAVAEYFKGLTEEEFIALAPAGVQQTLNSAKETVEKERIEIIKQLIVNVEGRKDREAKILHLKDKSLPDLRELLEYATLNSTVIGQTSNSRREKTETFLENFFGSGTGESTEEEPTRNRSASGPLLPTLSAGVDLVGVE